VLFNISSVCSFRKAKKVLIFTTLFKKFMQKRNIFRKIKTFSQGIVVLMSNKKTLRSTILKGVLL